MRLTVASIHALLASGALAASIDPRNIQTAQQCLGKIQSAEEAMNTAINASPLSHHIDLRDKQLTSSRVSTLSPMRALTPFLRVYKAPRARWTLPPKS